MDAKRQIDAQPAILEPDEVIQDAPLVHLRITGRHGVFVLLRGADEQDQAVVDTRPATGPACTCGGCAAGGECEHVGLLRACGFLQAA